MGDVDRRLRVDGGDLDLKLVAASQADLTLDVSDGVASPVYGGPYIVTPLAWQWTNLPTTGKRMDADIDVEPIPYLLTSNPAGGKTATIG